MNAPLWKNALSAAFAATVLGFAASALAANGKLVLDRSDDYYVIEDYADLKAFASKVNSVTSKYNGKLTADITATDTDWTPIGNEDRAFTGIFDGQSHTITGLDNADATYILQYAGLFGHVANGTVRNVGVVGGNIQSYEATAYVGGIVGYLDHGTVENCFFSGSVAGDSSNAHCAGGIVGHLAAGVVRNCHSTASLRGYHAGGIVGVMVDGIVKTCCYAGYRPSDSSYTVFGTIVGYALNGTISHCYHDNLKADPAVGCNDSATVSSVEGLLTQYFTDPAHFAGFDFGNVWYMGDSGPMLRVVFAEHPYADPTDEAHPVKTAVCIPVTENTTTFQSEWYVASFNVGVSGRIAVEGDANLILGDGCTLRAYGGIELTGTNRLTVWCQSGGSGTLVANGRDDDAAIGGNGSGNGADARPGGVLTVHGGTVTATASGAGAGIGGGGGDSTGFGDAGDGGTVRIDGGTVTAVSEGAGAGIGGGGRFGFGSGDGGKGGTVRIYGGTVTAGSEDGGVAIGGGQGSGNDADGALFIASPLGVVAAKWESHLAGAQPVARAERVAACHSNKWAKVSPCRQDHASLTEPCPACGLCPPVSYIDPSGPTVSEKTRTDCFGVFDDTEVLYPGCWYATVGNTTLAHRLVVDGDANLILRDGATLTAGQGIRVAAGDSLAIWGQAGRSGGLVAMYSGGAAIGDGPDDIGAERLAIDGIRVYASETAAEPVAADRRESVCRSEWARLVPCTEHNAYDMQGRCLFCRLGLAGPVHYRDPTDADVPDKVCADYVFFTGQTELSNGWYVARGAVQTAGRVEVAGDVHLVLCDGAEMTVGQGFHVTGTNRFTVWGQSDNQTTAGKLTVPVSADSAAGIGGNLEEAGGTVTINGGVLAVTGGQDGAGIGGGMYGAGGDVTIAGGTVTARSGSGGAGIGGGTGGSGDTITIAGGTVTAVSEGTGAGIGGGARGGGGTITIAGGTVTANGGARSAGIGGSFERDGGTITISGGTVTANGGNEGAGIGGGEEGNGTITISGGSVTATGGRNGAGIGGGEGGNGTITISGGTVTANGGGGAAIGGGVGGNGTITISGGTVTANGGGGGAGIGGGEGGNGFITIVGGTVTAWSGGGEAEAIGKGDSGKNRLGSLAIDGMRVFKAEWIDDPVAAADREETCRNWYVKLEVCPHDGDSGLCPWCGVVLAYATWAAGNGIAGAWNAKDADGIANVFRYLFDKPAGTDGLGILALRFDGEGRAVVVTAPVVNGEGFACSVESAASLDWTDTAKQPLDASGETTVPDPGTPTPGRFFRLSVKSAGE